MIKSVQDYLINTKIWVSLMIAFLSLFFGLLNHHIDYRRTLIVFFATIAAYNFICFHQEWGNKGINKKSFYLFSISFIITVLLILIEKDNIALITNMLLLGIIVIMYNSKILYINLRTIALLKIFIISFVWTYAILWIGNFMPLSLSLFFAVFLFVLGVTIPFDIYDMEEDTILTIPKWLGVSKSKYISYLSLITSTILFYITFRNTNNLDYIICWSLACFIIILLIFTMKKNSDFFYTRFWIEASISFPFLLLIIDLKK